MSFGRALTGIEQSEPELDFFFLPLAMGNLAGAVDSVYDLNLSQYAR